MTPEQRRGFRGVVRWLLPAARRRWENTSEGFSPPQPRDLFQFSRRPRGRGRCRWCGLACEPRRFWHDSCLDYYCCGRGLTEDQRGHVLIRGGEKNRCAECGSGKSIEHDHIVPIKLASIQGPRQWVRALMPENLQRLCQECHARKTVADRAAIAAAKTERGVV